MCVVAKGAKMNSERGSVNRQIKETMDHIDFLQNSLSDVFSGDMNCTEFLQGQRDCKDGIPHVSGMHKDYDRGFSAQYHLEESLTAKSMGGENGYKQVI